MHSIAWWPTLIVLAIATFTDLRNRRIPNWLVLPFLVAGICVAGRLHGWSGIGHSLSGVAVGALLFGVLYWLGGMGMGDLKLCAAIGAWIGPSQLLFALVITSMVGGIMAFAGRRPADFSVTYSRVQASWFSVLKNEDCVLIQS